MGRKLSMTGIPLTLIGILLTLAYVGGLYFLFDDRLAEVRGLKLNEVGDLLAGVFGPLAILWLILGFLQQGISMRQHAKEIAQSAMALSMQVAEMEAQKKRRKSAIAPSFQFRYIGNPKTSGVAREIDVEIKNGNGGVRKVKIDFEDERCAAKPLLLAQLGSGGCNTVTFTFNSDTTGCIPFSVRYIDSDDESGECKFEMEIQRFNGPAISGYRFKPIFD